MPVEPALPRAWGAPAPAPPPSTCPRPPAPSGAAPKPSSLHAKSAPASTGSHHPRALHLVVVTVCRITRS